MNIVLRYALQLGYEDSASVRSSLWLRKVCFGMIFTVVIKISLQWDLHFDYEVLRHALHLGYKDSVLP